MPERPKTSVSDEPLAQVAQGVHDAGRPGRTHGDLHVREDGGWLAELLVDLERYEAVRLHLTEALRQSWVSMDVNRLHAWCQALPTTALQSS